MIRWSGPDSTLGRAPSHQWPGRVMQGQPGDPRPDAHRLSAVRLLVLLATASLARRLRLAPRKDPQAVVVLTAGPANPLRKASPAAPRKLVQASPPPGRRLLGKTPRPSAPRRESPQLSTSGQVLGLKISARRFGRIASRLRLCFVRFLRPEDDQNGDCRAGGWRERRHPCRQPGSDRHLDRRRGPWRLPGPDSYRLVVLSLSLGLLLSTTPFRVRRWRAPRAGWTHQAVAKFHRGGLRGCTRPIFGPTCSVSDQPLVRSWEGIARMRALGSQSPPPTPGSRAEVRTSHTPESSSPFCDGLVCAGFFPNFRGLPSG
jgi:hypothetical protein